MRIYTFYKLIHSFGAKYIESYEEFAWKHNRQEFYNDREADENAIIQQSVAKQWQISKDCKDYDKWNITTCTRTNATARSNNTLECVMTLL